MYDDNHGPFFLPHSTHDLLYRILWEACWIQRKVLPLTSVRRKPRRMEKCFLLFSNPQHMEKCFLLFTQLPHDLLTPISPEIITFIEIVIPRLFSRENIVAHSSSHIALKQGQLNRWCNWCNRLRPPNKRRPSLVKNNYI